MSSYIDHLAEDGAVHSWAAHTLRGLKFQYGAKRAARIVAGNDKATQRDLAAWRSLGGPRIAA